MRYANEAAGGARSVGLTVWLSARLPVPHLSLYVGVRGGQATLMADHTQLDWRPALRRIDVPCLVLAGGKSQIFPLEGVKEVGRLIPGARTVVFEHEDHWLYIEDFRRFASLVSDFAANGALTDESVLSQLRVGDEDRLIGYKDAPSARGSPGSSRASPGGNATSP